MEGGVLLASPGPWLLHAACGQFSEPACPGVVLRASAGAVGNAAVIGAEIDQT